ncbi:MAG: hypothetical protein ACMZI0_19115 [Symbiopectobacterium sp.]|uniref:hypothetical protein n=1 Tax=Symbiopectobacterium sp. TaxID=2952789 RepID=UPI0039EB7176
MKRVSPHKLVLLSFTQGTLFWTASGTAVSFFPLLAATLHLPAHEAGLFVAGAAIGRAVFQPCAGLMITADNAGSYYFAGLACAVGSSVILVYAQHPGWLTTARLMEGIGLSLCRFLANASESYFVVSWRTLLNRMAHLRFFDAINDSYVVSQNIGRTLGPAIGGIFGGLLWYSGRICLPGTAVYAVPSPVIPLSPPLPQPHHHSHAANATLMRSVQDYSAPETPFCYPSHRVFLSGIMAVGLACLCRYRQWNDH